MAAGRRTTGGQGTMAGRLRLAVLWLAGLDLRITVLALPPLLPVVAGDLGLDRTAVGILTTLPVLLLGVAALLGSALIARVGAHRALIVGLVTVAVAGALRGVGASRGVLFACTLVMGVGIAVVQPALPTLVRDWTPDAVGPATALYGNGLLVGEALAASLTLPVVLAAVGSWQASLALWSAPVALTAGLAVVADRTASPAPGRPPTPAPATPEAPRRTWSLPNWRDTRVWKLGLVQGGGSAVFFATNAFLPGYLHTIGSPGLVGPALTALDVSQLLASGVMLALARRLVARRTPLIVIAAGLLAAVAGLLVAPAPDLIAPVVVIGVATALLLLLTLALPPIWGAQEDVAQLSAGMFSVGYSLAFVLPVLGGLVADATGSAHLVMAPALVGALLSLGAATRIPRRRG